MQQPFHFFLLLFITAIICSHFLRTGTSKYISYGALNRSSLPMPDLPSANISTTWKNIRSQFSNTVQSGVIIRFIFAKQRMDPVIGCGFICTAEFVDPARSCESFYFSIFLGLKNPEIVWSANRDRPVRENATLEFSKNGDLLLLDFDGTHVWSTGTSGKSVVGMELNKAVWSSMDYPTDSLVLGQTLREGQRLTANVSPANSSKGPLYLTVVRNGIHAFVGSQLYYENEDTAPNKRQKETTYVSFNNGSLDISDGSGGMGWMGLSFSPANSFQYMQLDYAGRLRVYAWNFDRWSLITDVIYVDGSDDDCGYPTICGEYGICSVGRCSCPDSSNFTLIDKWYPNAGCKPSTAVSCKSYKTQQFLHLPNVSYFGFDYGMLNSLSHTDYIMPNSTVEACKQACLANCSCKAAFFRYDPDASNGYCYLPPELYSLKNNVPEIGGYNSSAFIKVQSFPSTNSTFSTVNTNVSKGKKVSTGTIVAASVGALLACFLVALCVIAFVMRRCSSRDDADDDEFDMLLGLLTRFAFEDLKVATDDFSRKLGEGGFGSVFEGTLIDGTKIAVKKLNSVGQGKKEFLAEVETIDSIHHLHLVRLVGFCAEKSYRLLIYEYMLNGSLDKWIFYKGRDTVLDWQTRRKIITDIAKGLTYLHEECRQKIVHLDIKPENILLDENFNAKVSDFGLAKLIDRDQIEVMTRMRGTPGYLAPEWLTSIINQKVDVFSFGVVVLEAVCGRRNLDYSKDEDSFHLIGLLQKKIAENKLVDMLDYRSTDMKVHIEDVIMIIHLAMWCIQSDSNKRPLMSVVLKVLDGSMEVEADLDYNFSNPTRYVPRNVNIMVSALPIPSILSGPR